MNKPKDLPPHLSRYIVEQNYDRYTSIDQSIWRFIMRQLKFFLSKNAHPCYVDGLKRTGISVERIPKISEMSEKLEEFGWRAIPVSGFIPPAAFMELQSYGYLPIASDMRTLGHLMYTPAPDIVHEAAGHAPILIDPDFCNYLKSYAEVAAKAILNKEDLDVYDAIRVLSDLKEDPKTTEQQLKEAENKLEKANSEAEEPSEAALLARMNWWTAEYGLIGPIDQPQIYGAGLLSSLGESRSAVTDATKKIPFSLDCLNFSYDITEPQPQLFVAEKFEDLTLALEKMADQMAFRRGGLYGLNLAKKAQTVNTAEYDSGLQVSGRVTDFMTEEGDPTYIQFTGPTQLCFNGHVIEGHNTERHEHGFGSPVGNLIDSNQNFFEMRDDDLRARGIEIGKKASLTFESGIEVEGVVKSFTRKENKLLLITFTECTASNGSKVLFDPEWGEYDMAIGSKVTSVFGGAADRGSYINTDNFSNQRIPERNLSPAETELDKLYGKVRLIRENYDSFDSPEDDLRDILNVINKDFPEDWLLKLEILELASKTKNSPQWKSDLQSELSKVGGTDAPHAESVRDGLMIYDVEL